MPKASSPFLVVLATAAVAVAVPGTAFAYLDPGTGSMILQGVFGALLAAGVALGLFWERVKKLFKGRRPEEENPPATAEEADAEPR